MSGEAHVELGTRFADALTFAHEAHLEQRRKGSSAPYIAHLLGTASLVIEDGGSEDEAIAALLHDAAEDQGGEAMLDRIEAKFGPDVSRIVAACSDTFEIPKPAWRARKESYVASLASKRPDELRVSSADKVCNARAIVFDRRVVGDAIWDRFSASREESLWYYRALADSFASLRPGPLSDELSRLVDELERGAAT